MIGHPVPESPDIGEPAAHLVKARIDYVRRSFRSSRIAFRTRMLCSRNSLISG